MSWSEASRAGACVPAGRVSPRLPCGPGGEASPSRRVLLLALAGCTLAGCGFELRQPPKLSFQRIALTGFTPRSPMAEELGRQLSPGVSVVDTPTKAEVVLQALEDVRERSVVATTSAAQVRELQLRVKLSFRASTPSGRALIPRTELLLARDLSYIETTALAKEYEEAELFRDMHADVARQVLRRLATITL